MKPKTKKILTKVKITVAAAGTVMGATVVAISLPLNNLLGDVVGVGLIAINLSNLYGSIKQLKVPEPLEALQQEA